MSDPIHRAGTLDVVVSRRSRETANVALLEVKASSADRPLPSFTSGAHVDMHLANGCIRQYSICSDPADPSLYRFGILLESNSRGGSRSAHALKVGDIITISEPRNHFPLFERAERSVLVAGGIGVTPLLAMAYRLRALGAQFELHYCSRNRLTAAFSKQLAKFEDCVHWHFDDAKGLTTFHPADVLPAPNTGTFLYVCGPSGFMNFVTSAAQTAGWEKSQIHTEAFEAPALQGGESEFDVVARKSGLTIRVRGNQTIAQALVEAGLEVSVSCEQGICGTCLTRVLSGSPDHRDTYQTDDEKNANAYIATCCSRSTSSTLVLDI